jgi:hypothetical protein
MFQFSGFAFRLLGISRLQRDGLPHSEIRGYNGYLLLPAAYRSLSRPSSPLRAKAFTMRPYLLFSNIILLISLLFYCQYVKERYEPCPQPPKGGCFSKSQPAGGDLGANPQNIINEVLPGGDTDQSSPERRCSSRTFRYGYLVTT